MRAAMREFLKFSSRDSTLTYPHNLKFVMKIFTFLNFWFFQPCKSIIRHQYRSDIKWKDCESIFEEIALKRSSEYDEPVLFKNDISTIYMAKKGIFCIFILDSIFFFKFSFLKVSLLTKMNSNCITGFSFLSNIYCVILLFFMVSF